MHPVQQCDFDQINCADQCCALCIRLEQSQGLVRPTVCPFHCFVGSRQTSPPVRETASECFYEMTQLHALCK